LGKPTIKRLKLLDCRLHHFEILLNSATNVETLSVSLPRVHIQFSHVFATATLQLDVLARVLPKMKRLSELNLSSYDQPLGLSEEVKHALVQAVEQHANLTTVTLEDPHGNFTPAEQQRLRSCGNRNVMLRELIRASHKLNTPAPPQVPSFLTTCHNSPTAALALLVALKDKLGLLNRRSACLKRKRIEWIDVERSKHQ